MLGLGWDTGLLSVWNDSSPARMETLPCPSYDPDDLPCHNTLSVTACFVVGGTLGLANVCLGSGLECMERVSEPMVSAGVSACLNMSDRSMVIPSPVPSSVSLT